MKRRNFFTNSIPNHLFQKNYECREFVIKNNEAHSEKIPELESKLIDNNAISTLFQLEKQNEVDLDNTPKDLTSKQFLLFLQSNVAMFFQEADYIQETMSNSFLEKEEIIGSTVQCDSMPDHIENLISLDREDDLHQLETPKINPGEDISVEMQDFADNCAMDILNQAAHTTPFKMTVNCLESTKENVEYTKFEEIIIDNELGHDFSSPIPTCVEDIRDVSENLHMMTPKLENSIQIPPDLISFRQNASQIDFSALVEGEVNNFFTTQEIHDQPSFQELVMQDLMPHDYNNSSLFHEKPIKYDAKFSQFLPKNDTDSFFKGVLEVLPLEEDSQTEKKQEKTSQNEKIDKKLKKEFSADFIEHDDDELSFFSNQKNVISSTEDFFEESKALKRLISEKEIISQEIKRIPSFQQSEEFCSFFKDNLKKQILKKLSEEFQARDRRICATDGDILILDIDKRIQGKSCLDYELSKFHEVFVLKKLSCEVGLFKKSVSSIEIGLDSFWISKFQETITSNLKKSFFTKETIPQDCGFAENQRIDDLVPLDFNPSEEFDEKIDFHQKILKKTNLFNKYFSPKQIQDEKAKFQKVLKKDAKFRENLFSESQKCFDAEYADNNIGDIHMYLSVISNLPSISEFKSMISEKDDFFAEKEEKKEEKKNNYINLKRKRKDFEKEEEDEENLKKLSLKKRFMSDFQEDSLDNFLKINQNTTEDKQNVKKKRKIESCEPKNDLPPSQNKILKNLMNLRNSLFLCPRNIPKIHLLSHFLVNIAKRSASDSIILYLSSRTTNLKRFYSYFFSFFKYHTLIVNPIFLSKEKNLSRIHENIFKKKKTNSQEPTTEVKVIFMEFEVLDIILLKNPNFFENLTLVCFDEQFLIEKSSISELLSPKSRKELSKIEESKQDQLFTFERIENSQSKLSKFSKSFFQTVVVSEYAICKNLPFSMEKLALQQLVFPNFEQKADILCETNSILLQGDISAHQNPQNSQNQDYFSSSSFFVFLKLVSFLSKIGNFLLSKLAPSVNISNLDFDSFPAEKLSFFSSFFEKLQQNNEIEFEMKGIMMLNTLKVLKTFILEGSVQTGFMFLQKMLQHPKYGQLIKWMEGNVRKKLEKVLEFQKSQTGSFAHPKFQQLFEILKSSRKSKNLFIILTSFPELPKEITESLGFDGEIVQIFHIFQENSTEIQQRNMLLPQNNKTTSKTLKFCSNFGTKSISEFQKLVLESKKDQNFALCLSYDQIDQSPGFSLVNFLNTFEFPKQDDLNFIILRLDEMNPLPDNLQDLISQRKTIKNNISFEIIENFTDDENQTLKISQKNDENLKNPSEKTMNSMKIEHYFDSEFSKNDGKMKFSEITKSQIEEILKNCKNLDKQLITIEDLNENFTQKPQQTLIDSIWKLHSFKKFQNSDEKTIVFATESIYSDSEFVELLKSKIPHLILFERDKKTNNTPCDLVLNEKECILILDSSNLDSKPPKSEPEIEKTDILWPILQKICILKQKFDIIHLVFQIFPEDSSFLEQKLRIFTSFSIILSNLFNSFPNFELNPIFSFCKEQTIDICTNLISLSPHTFISVLMRNSSSFLMEREKNAEIFMNSFPTLNFFTSQALLYHFYNKFEQKIETNEEKIEKFEKNKKKKFLFSERFSMDFLKSVPLSNGKKENLIALNALLVLMKASISELKETFCGSENWIPEKKLEIFFKMLHNSNSIPNLNQECKLDGKEDPEHFTKILNNQKQDSPFPPQLSRKPSPSSCGF